MRRAVFIAASLVSSLVFAYQPREVAVKVTSHDLRTDKKFSGSGLLFKRDGQVYVVTSDHVVLHSNKDCVHKIRTPKLGELDATYLTSNWGVGLGLLKVKDVPALELPDYAELAPGAVQAGDPIEIVGYPVASNTPIVDKRGHVDQPQFASPLFVDIRQLIHVVQAHGEYGMSGGPLFVKGHFAGLLSHQILKHAAVPQNELLILPAADIHAWLDGYFADPAHYQSPFVQPVQLQYESDAPDEVCSRDQGFNYLKLFGYDAGYQVYISDLEKELSTAAPRDATHFLDRARQFAQANRRHGANIYVFNFRKTGDFWSQEREGFSSLTEFFRLLQRPDIEPVTITGINFADKYLEQMYPLARELDSAMEPFRYIAGGPGSLLANRLIFLGYAIEEQHTSESNYRYAKVKAIDLHALLENEEYREEWKALDQRASWAADRIRECLKKLIPIFEKLTV